MAHVDVHAPGSFCWFELATTDQNAAKSFYKNLFHYDVFDAPMGPGETYTIFKLDGRDAAAACTMPEHQRALNVPPHWAIYVAVESADASAQRAAELGGTVLAPAFDVMDAGRSAVLRDPTGAVFHVWEPKGNKGTGIIGVEGSVCWADLNTPDASRASKFYSGLFGWRISAGEDDTSGYLHIQHGEEFIGGIPGPAQLPDGMPPHWMLYFQVADCEASAEKAQRLGGRILVGVMTLENVGRFAAVDDPQGAGFALFEPMAHS